MTDTASTTRQGDGDLQLQITHFWNARGGDYDAQPRHGLLDEREKAAWLEALRELLPPAPADVLDVGAGTGFMALLLAELGHRVTATDLAEGMLTTARAKAAGMANPPAFLVGDAQEPEFPGGSFDVVTNRHLLWTLLDPARAFANWHRLLRPGGRVVAIDGLWWLEREGRDEQPSPRAGGEENERGYTARLEAALPLRCTRSLDEILEIARAAGLAGVRAVHLEELGRVEAEVLPPSEGMQQPRYAIVATRGA